MGWSSVLPDYDNYPEKIRRGVIPFSAASLIYLNENNYLQSIYPSNHPIFAQPIFTNLSVYNKLRGSVVLAYSSCPDSSMSASGVPALITVSREKRSFRDAYKRTFRRQEQKIQELEAAIICVVQEQPRRIVELLLERFKIYGAIPITMDDIRATVSEYFTSQDGPLAVLSESIANQSEMLERALARRGGSIEETTTEQTADAIRPPTAIFYTWSTDACLDKVPEGFGFPSFNVGIIWNL